MSGTRSMQHSAQDQRSRLGFFLIACLLCLLLATVIAPSWQQAWAADDAAAQGDSGSNNNIFLHIIKSVKWMWPVIAILSISLVALIVLLAMDLRMSEAVPPAFVEEFT